MIAHDIYLKAYQLLRERMKIVLVRTIQRMGSAPRNIGSMCIITQEGQLIGTIGGGILEHIVVDKAKSLFSQPVSQICRFNLSSDDVARSGMICGGDVELFLEPVFPENKVSFDIFKALVEQIYQKKTAILVSLVSSNINVMDINSRVLLKDDNTELGNIIGFDKNKLEIQSVEDHLLVELNPSSEFVFIEKIQSNPMVMIFGAGHISTFLASLAKLVGFSVTVIDDRKEFANRDKFPDVDDIIVLPFAQVFNHITITSNTYIVIVTRGHLFDKTVLEAALNTDPGYLGMIGSRHKKKVIYDALIKQGFSQEALSRVHAPIGVRIGAETPEEIAVSIIAELIQMRSVSKKSCTQSCLRCVRK